jgi:predicted nucleic acid-binding protein
MYLDTSALVKLVHPEAESDALRRYLVASRRTPKSTAAISLTELPRAVRRANHDHAGRVLDRGTMVAETEQASQILATLRIVEMSRALLADAASAGGPFLRSLDAIHLISATRLAIGLTAFVTYDKRLAAAAQDAGLPVTTPA